MSTTILVHNNVRQALRALPFSSSHPLLHPHLHSHSNPATPSPFRASPLPPSHTPPPMPRSLPGSYFQSSHHAHRQSHTTLSLIAPKQLLPPDFLLSLSLACHRTYLSPSLSLYLADLFSAARHHPQLDGTFLTARAMKDAEDLARASRVLGMDLTGGELVRNPDDLTHSFTGNGGGADDDNDGVDDASTRGYDDVTDEIGSGSATIEIASDGLCLDSGDQDGVTADIGDGIEIPRSLYVSEADIARIVARVITHRLRVRDGPHDEVLASAVFGAAFGNDEMPEDGGTRSTVKDILVGILGEV